MRSLLVPETIQTSAMDCGPAALKSLLEGHGIHASYGRLREACQTDVDGSSIDSLETTAVALGLEASQILLPIDFFFEPEAKALPCLVVVRQAGGMTHFVVLWRKHGPLVQVMDPAVGRRWTTVESLRTSLYQHAQSVPAADWFEWATKDAFLKPLKRRLKRLGCKPALLDRALASGNAVPLARLDAAARMVERIGQGSGALVAKLAESDIEIPAEYWSAAPDPDDTDSLIMRGAVLIQVTGKGAAASELPPDLSAALIEKPPRPGWAILREFLADGIASPAFILTAVTISAAGVVVEAVLWRGFLNMARELTTAGQRAAALAQLVALSAGMLVLEFGLVSTLLRFGRRLELRLRLRFLEKIPLLGDRYFSSRPISDMAQRVHNVQMLRMAPTLAMQFWRPVVQTVATLAAIAWLYPDALAVSALIAVGALGIPLAVQPALAERDLKARTHAGALTRYYLDALLGLTAIRAHGADRALRHEQGELLGEWTRASLNYHHLLVRVETVQFLFALALSAWLIWTRLESAADIGGLLLLAYWVLNLPMLGREAAAIAWQYPIQRNTALRLAEPLGAPEEPFAEAQAALDAPVALRFDNVSVQAGGHPILDGIDLEIAAGEHIGIVGPSGAGKSSFVGLLLGWHRAAAGSVRLNGKALDAVALAALRRVTAWVDPQVQLWNRSLLENIRYGAGSSTAAMDDVLEQAELSGVVERLEDGLQTPLGEGGGLVSGGEGQRVRMARAMARAGVRLVILDEPARGLDRERRQAMMDRARRRWRNATLLCITHDVGGTLGFERVLVMEGGRIVEDGAPAELAANPESRYRQLLDAEDAVRTGLWSDDRWRRLRMQEGRLI